MSTLKPLTIDIVSDVVCPGAISQAPVSRCAGAGAGRPVGCVAAVLPQFLGCPARISVTNISPQIRARSKPIRDRRARRDCRRRRGSPTGPSWSGPANTTDCHRLIPWPKRQANPRDEAAADGMVFRDVAISTTSTCW